jgi:hypothetical protein
MSTHASCKTVITGGHVLLWSLIERLYMLSVQVWREHGAGRSFLERNCVSWFGVCMFTCFSDLMLGGNLMHGTVPILESNMHGCCSRCSQVWKESSRCCLFSCYGNSEITHGLLQVCMGFGLLVMYVSPFVLPNLLVMERILHVYSVLAS